MELGDNAYRNQNLGLYTVVEHDHIYSLPPYYLLNVGQMLNVLQGPTSSKTIQRYTIDVFPPCPPPSPPTLEPLQSQASSASSSSYSDLINIYPASSFSSEPYLEEGDKNELLRSLDIFTDKEISRVCDIMTESQETKGFIIPLQICKDVEPYEEWRGPETAQITKWFDSKLGRKRPRENLPKRLGSSGLELSLGQINQEIIYFSMPAIKEEVNEVIVEVGDDEEEEDVKPWVDVLQRDIFKSTSQLMIEGKMSLAELLDVDFPSRQSSSRRRGFDSKEELGKITLTELLRTNPPMPINSKTNDNTETRREQKRKWRNTEPVHVQIKKEEKVQKKRKTKKIKIEPIEVKEKDNGWPPLEPYYSYEYIMHEGLKDRPKKSPKPFRCPVPFCPKIYKNQNGLKYHARHGHCPPQNFFCPECNKKLGTMPGMLSHRKKHFPLNPLQAKIFPATAAPNSSDTESDEEGKLFSISMDLDEALLQEGINLISLSH